MLTGTRDDGAAGLYSIKARQGIAVVQSPEEAEWPQMPQNAISYTIPDHCVGIEEMAPLLGKLSHELAARLQDVQDANPESAQPDGIAPLVCPDCGGLLDQEKLGTKTHFRCQTGHAYSLESLTVAHSDALERALWITIRTLKEQIEMHERLARSFMARGQTDFSERFYERADAARLDIATIREVLDRVVRLKKVDEVDQALAAP